MYRVAVDHAPPGAILAASLFDRDGRLLVQAGLALRAYDLLGQLDRGDETARLIVRQHHERHDGSGYPDGLSGLHSVQRTRSEQLDRSLILLVSDIAAVADVFNALMVHRSHRPPRAPDLIKQMLTTMAGNKLSAAVVDALMERWVPPLELSPQRLPAESAPPEPAANPARANPAPAREDLPATG